jgi:capsular polysaccharide biosynthesis protein
MKPTYTAETQLFVAISNSGSVQELQQGNTFSQARVQSYVKTVDSPLVLQPAIDALGLSISAEKLAQRVKASTDLNTVLINITVNDESPVQAAAIAQAVATSLVTSVDTLERPKNGGSSPVSLTVTKPAVAPELPSAPNTRLNLILGVLIGLGLGLAVSMLRTTLDSRIRGEADLRHITDAPLLGGITFDQDAVGKPLLTQTASQSTRAESFRQLRTNLQFANVAGKARTVLITSSLPGEGKSTTATNLAIALSQAGQSVCLVDADLRRPMVNEYLGLDRNAGLTTALVGAARRKRSAAALGRGRPLRACTSGENTPEPERAPWVPHEMQQPHPAAWDRRSTRSSSMRHRYCPVTDAAVLVAARWRRRPRRRIAQVEVSRTCRKSLRALWRWSGSNLLGDSS